MNTGFHMVKLHFTYAGKVSLFHTSAIKAAVVKNHWSIDQWHLELMNYSGFYIPHSTTSHID